MPPALPQIAAPALLAGFCWGYCSRRVLFTDTVHTPRANI
ncbi:hypothetical protein SLEP1_g35630 [Rubroshorea leprosula]|uniref:Uncharacterized protein n=1 Tax=Rubroshorea leprosula TaxID=152421 RepID=A0AAV5KNX7_9ROSI|nr:hypothetical protein SLEP1_g35630 [Rubroshorea leprosula]